MRLALAPTQSGTRIKIGLHHVSSAISGKGLSGGRPARFTRRRRAEGLDGDAEAPLEAESAEAEDADEDAEQADEAEEDDDDGSEDVVRPSATETEHDVSWSYFAGGIAPALLTREEEVAIGRRLVQARAVLLALQAETPEPIRRRITQDGDETHGFREREMLRLLERSERAVANLPGRLDEAGAQAVRDFRERLSSAVAAYRVDRDRLLEANLRLVLSLGRRYRRNGVPFLDLVQEGTLGLIRAVEKYDPDRDVRFGTYAVWWIWQQIGRAGDLNAGIIRTPLHWNQIRRKVGRATQQLQTGGAKAEREDVAAASGVDAERLDLVHQNFQCLSLESPIGGGDDRPLEELLASDSPDPENDVAATDLNHRLESALAELHRKNPREADVLRLRFGTGNQDTMTLEEIGKMLNVSRERVRQIEARALKLLLPICERQGLRVYFD